MPSLIKMSIMMMTIIRIVALMMTMLVLDGIIITMATKTMIVRRARLVHFLVCRNPRQEGIRDKSA